MGTQSSRLIYQGKDLKDLFYRGEYLSKLYKGNTLVWEKLYRFFLWSSYFDIFDLDSKKVIENKNRKKYITKIKNNVTCGIALLYEKETKQYNFSVTKDNLTWKKIEGISFLENQNDGYFSRSIVFSLTENGFFIYCMGSMLSNKKKNELYLVEVGINLECEVKKIYSSDIWFRYPQQHGISDSFYGIQYDKSKEYIMHRVKKDGSVSSQQMLGNFIKDDVVMEYGGIGVWANGNGDIYIYCPNVNANNGGTYLFHASGLQNADYPTIAFAARNSKFLGVARCGIDIVYDSYQTMFIAHGERKTQGGITQDIISSYKKSEFYEIDAVGKTLRILQKDSADGDMYVKCIGLEGLDILGIRFSQEGKISSRNVDPKTTGYIYYEDINKGISSGGETSLEIRYDKKRNDRCFIGYYSWRDDMTSRERVMAIYFDNLFWRESDNNFAVVVGEE